jgi:anaerobic ribonucleoside-triphosphate reductase activating protein
MNYCNIKKNDIANGPGVRVTLFVSGCTHHCEGCFQPETWNFSYGEPFTQLTWHELFAALQPSYVSGLTLLGGEPFEPENQRALLPFLRMVREQFPQKNIWGYSGYLYEELTGMIPGTGRARCEVTDEMLSLLDVLVDGEFVQEKKNISLAFRGSENQRLIDLKKSQAAGQVVLWES